jgi:hypothetical protein
LIIALPADDEAALGKQEGIQNDWYCQLAVRGAAFTHDGEAMLGTRSCAVKLL